MWLATLLACGSFGKLDGTDLGKPESVVYGNDESGNVMLVFSDQEDLCSLLTTTEAPDAPFWWVVSAWTTDGAKQERELSVKSHAGFLLFGEESTYDSGDGTLWIENADDEGISGDVTLSFATGDTLGGRYEATYCDAPLFVGLADE